MTHHDPHHTHEVHEEVHHDHVVHGSAGGSYMTGAAAWMIAMVLVVIFALIVIFALFAGV